MILPQPNQSLENIPKVQTLNSPQNISIGYKIPFMHNHGQSPNASHVIMEQASQSTQLPTISQLKNCLNLLGHGLKNYLQRLLLKQ